MEVRTVSYSLFLYTFRRSCAGSGVFTIPRNPNPATGIPGLTPHAPGAKRPGPRLGSVLRKDKLLLKVADEAKGKRDEVTGMKKQRMKLKLKNQTLQEGLQVQSRPAHGP